LAYDRKQYETAVSGFRKALEVSPDATNALYGLGLAYMMLGEHEKSRTHFKKFLRIVPSGPWSEEAQRNLKQIEKNIPEADRN
jgi:tetratricopeptide (TPR) repeat protein